MGYARDHAAVSSSRTAVRSPRRLPVPGSTPKLSRTPSRMRNLSSEFVLGASSEVTLRSLSGRASLRIVEERLSVLAHRDPVVYGRSYFSHNARMRTLISAYLSLGRSGTDGPRLRKDVQKSFGKAQGDKVSVELVLDTDRAALSGD